MTAATVAAWVAGEPIDAAEVDERLTALRSGAFGARLPHGHTAEGRNARRWVVQLICAERIVRAELVARGVADDAVTAPVSPQRALALGGVAAAVLAAVPAASALLEPIEVPEPDVRAYYDRNPDLFADRGVAYAEARAAIAAELGSALADREFARWLDARTAEAVRLGHGFEHPSDPSHPDATHRH